VDQSLFSQKLNFYRNKRKANLAPRPKQPPSWWTPVWRGLIADPNSKHRKSMGSAVWIYLYLLTYANRKTGIVRRTQQAMVQDTGYPLRTIQFNLHKLNQRGYLTKKQEGRYLKIQIEKWKAFNDPKWNQPEMG